MRRLCFTSLEGGEGSGKDSVAKRIVPYIESKGYGVVNPREPGTTELGEHMRKILQHNYLSEPFGGKQEVLMFLNARAQLVDRIIAPALKDGKFIVCNRFADSTTVYQGVARGLGMDNMITLNNLAVGDYWPGLTLLYDVSIEEGHKRVDKRGKKRDRLEREPREFHQKVREGYLELASRFPERIKVVHTDNINQERVWKITKEILDREYNFK